MRCQAGVAEERELCPEVEETHAAVFGNSVPEHSLLVRMCVLEKKIRVIERLSWITLCGVGALVLRIVGAWLERLMG